MDFKNKDKSEITLAWRRTYYDFFHNYIPIEDSNLQNVFTPYSLCREILEKLEEYSGKLNENNRTYLAFNLEFVDVLMYNFGVEGKNITFCTDCKTKAMFVSRLSQDRYKDVDVLWLDILDDKWSGVMAKRTWDCCIMNPPYQFPTGGGNGPRDLWPSFVEKAISLIKDNGHIVAIHPSKWRKPEHKLFPIFQANNLLYLEIHDDNDGRKTFGAITRYDWYVLQKSIYGGRTNIKNENGEDSRVNISTLSFIPNYQIEKILSIVAKDEEEKCNVFYDSSSYHNQKDMSREKTGEYVFPCVYGMFQDGTYTYLYSKENKGHFGISKVILGIGRYLYPLIDMEGQYGITQNAFAILVNSKEEAEGIKKAIESEEFREIIKATKWGNFQTDYKMFKSFRKDWWREFIK